LIGLTWQSGEELKAFLEGGFFTGELYHDPEKAAYHATRTSGVHGVFKFFYSFFTSASAAFKAKYHETPGNNKEVIPVYSSITVISGIFLNSS